MKVLVTGATGTIGGAVAQGLLSRGDEVVGLTRSPERARGREPRITWHGWEPATERPPAEGLAGVDAVINMVGESIDQRWTEEAKRRIFDSRVAATRNLVDAMLAAPARPRVLVSGSAVGLYGDRGDELLDESAPPGETFDSRVCVAWEEAARGVEGDGVRLAVVRTGLVMTKEAGLLKELLLPFRLGVGGPVAGGRQYMPWIALDDEVRVLLWALDEEAASGTYNATAPNPVTNRDFSKALGRTLRRPAVMPIPKLALKARFGSELGEVAAGGQRAVPRHLEEQGFSFRFPEIEPALRHALA